MKENASPLIETLINCNIDNINTVVSLYDEFTDYFKISSYKTYAYLIDLTQKEEIKYIKNLNFYFNYKTTLSILSAYLKCKVIETVLKLENESLINNICRAPENYNFNANTVHDFLKISKRYWRKFAQINKEMPNTSYRYYYSLKKLMPISNIVTEEQLNILLKESESFVNIVRDIINTILN